MMLGHAALGARLMRGLTAGVLGMVLLWGWMAGYRLLCRQLGKVFWVSIPTRTWAGQARATPRDSGDS
jgi:hypothetical protein